MLRFLPDSWLAWLLRPFLMADPSVGLYYEEAAPDWRFCALLAVLLISALAGWRLRAAGTEHRRLLLALFVTFYIWTAVSGNGRYFIVGLLAAGPLLVAAWQWLPGSRFLRWTLLTVFCFAQAFTVHSMIRPGGWYRVAWERGAAVPVDDNPIRHRPALFVTLTGISWSMLVPSFHPDSRWINIGGQIDITPVRPEYPKAQAMLRTTLPMYMLGPASQAEDGEPDPQPGEAMRDAISQALLEHGLALTGAPCEALRTRLLPQGVASQKVQPPGAFWICPIRHADPQAVAAKASMGDPLADVFSRVEQHCPRFFPPGQAVSKRYNGHWMRYYLNSDTRLFVEDTGIVTYKYFRAIAPMTIGTIEEVRQGRLRLDCAHISGRYVPPWAAD